MAMNIPGLAGELKTAIEAAYGKPADNSAMLENFCTAIATSVISHIMANAQLNIIPGDIPVTVSVGTGIGANTTHPPLTGKIS